MARSGGDSGAAAAADGRPGALPPGRPLIVAVTGGMGAGKSTFCRLMARRAGVVHVDADSIVHGLLAKDRDVQAAVAERFGPELLDPAGGVDRARLAERAFSDPARLAQLEAILHPRVQAVLAGKVETLKSAGGVDIVLVEIPLLAESGVPVWCDLVVTVEAPRETRSTRLALKGMPAAAAARREVRQTRSVRRKALADLVVDNSAGLEALETCVEKLWQSWRGLPPAVDGGNQ
ncbi:MAG: dephospho-CoA kinase [Candidatus Eisenbacteria bacterium]